tara:strand:- start:173 stop:379 length:207 start_codon:yes stop_codon:yes gene_type:complete
MSDSVSAPSASSDPVPTTTSDSERITALETKLNALITILKNSFTQIDDDSGLRWVNTIENNKSEIENL